LLSTVALGGLCYLIYELGGSMAISVLFLLSIVALGVLCYFVYGLKYFKFPQPLMHFHTTRVDFKVDEVELNRLNILLQYALQKIGEIWAIYGQIVLAILIVFTIALLLLTKTISAEAGLPILSAISSFAIAKNTGERDRYQNLISDKKENQKD
jgi:hypothetical protein